MDKGEKPFYQTFDFWLVFAGVFLLSLLIGGLLTALFAGCPAFGWLLLGSLLAALLAGYLYHDRVASSRKRVVRRAASQRIDQLRSRIFGPEDLQ